MDSQSAETYDSSPCLAALVHFLDRIDQDTKEWYYAINGDHNHPFSLCNILGLSFDDTMVILETCGLAKRSNNKFCSQDEIAFRFLAAPSLRRVYLQKSQRYERKWTMNGSKALIRLFVAH